MVPMTAHLSLLLKCTVMLRLGAAPWDCSVPLCLQKQTVFAKYGIVHAISVSEIKILGVVFDKIL